MGRGPLVGELSTVAACLAIVLGMGILKDAILSVAISVTAVVGAESIGWTWYRLSLLWLGR
jgi:hypothetical protein